MKRIIQISSIIGLSLLLVMGVSAQTAEDVIAKHIKAHGGLKNYNKIKSMEISGDFTSFSTTGKFKTIKFLPKTTSTYCHSAIRISKRGTRPKGGSTKDKSAINW